MFDSNPEYGWASGSFDDGSPEDDYLDDDSSETVPCPDCRAEIYEAAEQCPYCGNYVVHRSDVWSGRSRWWIVLGLLGILAVILVLAGYSFR